MLQCWICAHAQIHSDTDKHSVRKSRVGKKNVQHVEHIIEIKKQ